MLKIGKLSGIICAVMISGCDFSEHRSDKEEKQVSAIDRKKEIDKLKSEVESLNWEVSRLSLKIRQVEGSKLVLDKKTGLWHFDVERKPFTGKAVENFPDGKPEAESDFLLGKKDGLERFWYPNGQLREQSQWFSGSAHGMFMNWNPEGKLIRSVRYKNGDLIESFVE